MAKKKKTKIPPVVNEHLQKSPDEIKAGAQSRPGSPMLRTCILFGVILAGLHAFTWLFALKGYIKWGYGTAHVVSWLLNSMGIANSVDYNIIHLKNDTWNVTSECTAVNAVFLFVSFVCAYSSALKSKALGLVSGIPLILAVNILRLVVLGWITEYWPRHAHFFHDFVWETVFIFFIILLWLAWINLVVDREKKIPAVPA